MTAECPDSELLRDYVVHSSETAFAVLVQRYLGVVYRTALRQVSGNAHAAEDITQAVFTLLARKAPSLVGHDSLVGWLHTTARYVARDIIRAEVRRKRYERQVTSMNADHEPRPDDWERLRPVIDDVLNELKPADRDAVLLRYFAELSFSAIGERLGVPENSARMRVQRALEKLQQRLRVRGVESASAALGLLLTSGAVAGTVPEHLASHVMASATTAAATPAATGTLMTLMTATKTALVAVVVISALSISGYTLYERHLAQADLAAANAELLSSELLGRKAATAAADAERSVNRVGTELERVRAAAAVATTPAVPDVNSSQSWNPRKEGLALLARHPELKRAFSEWVAAKVRFQYAPFFRQTNMTDAQIDRFIEIQGMGYTMQMGYGPAGKAVILALGDDDALASVPDQMRELLGDSGMKQWVQYNSAAGARTLVTQLAADLAFSETPLTPVQADALQSTLSAATPRKSRGQPQPDWNPVLASAQSFLFPAQQLALIALRDRNKMQQDRFVKVPQTTVRQDASAKSPAGVETPRL
jgi:RNA polymerase sigma factor (sigma-70 family)